MHSPDSEQNYSVGKGQADSPLDTFTNLNFIRTEIAIPSPADCIGSDQIIDFPFNSAWPLEKYYDAWHKCSRYGDFILPDTIRPFLSIEDLNEGKIAIAPREGYFFSFRPKPRHTN